MYQILSSNSNLKKATTGCVSGTEEVNGKQQIQQFQLQDL